MGPQSLDMFWCLLDDNLGCLKVKVNYLRGLGDLFVLPAICGLYCSNDHLGDKIEILYEVSSRFLVLGALLD